MNVVKIYGGLGNQLFQYALGKTMQQNGIDVAFDTSWYKIKRTPARPYLLDGFRIPGIKHGLIQTKKKIFNEVLLNYVKNPDYVKMDNCGFFGYWQHPSYFSSVEDTLREEIRLKKEYYMSQYVLTRQDVILTDSVAVHVRRGDYLSRAGHYVLSMDYYEQALAKFKGKNIFIFSDDIPWCKKNFTNCTFITLPDLQSFDLMRLCKHQVIANSTFSWWAAYLNSHSEKIIITPEKWRPDANDICQTDPDLTHPKNWIRIDCKGFIT